MAASQSDQAMVNFSISYRELVEVVRISKVALDAPKVRVMVTEHLFGRFDLSSCRISTICQNDLNILVSNFVKKLISKHKANNRSISKLLKESWCDLNLYLPDSITEHLREKAIDVTYSF